MARGTLIALLSLTLTGCGAQSLGTAGAASGSPAMSAGWTATLAVSDAMATAPCLLERHDGSLVAAYGRDKLGDRHVYLTTSSDGARWSAPAAVGKASFTDQEPALYEDAAGLIHLIFASNRSQDWALYESTSRDAASWSEPTVLNVGVGAPTHPSCAMLADGRLGLACESLTEPGVFVVRSASGTWGKPETIFEQGGGPSLAANAAGGFAVAYRYGSQAMWRQRSLSGTWSAASAIGDAAGLGLANGATGWWLATAANDEISIQEAKATGFDASTAVVATGASEEAPFALGLHTGERTLTFSYGTAGSLYVARSGR